MNIIKYPTDEAVDGAMKADEPILAAVSFDGSTAVMCPVDEAGEHHIMLMETGFKDTDIDRFFRIVLDKSGADWTFVCPPDYKNIPFKDKRIMVYHKDGFSIIADFLHEIGYIVGINIPKRYRRHLDVMTNDTY
ncbi:MAG: hypothetical protein IJ779_06345 [Ruminococcus sp.]|nr:hypothetical protein [Ruminococcus sp.]